MSQKIKATNQVGTDISKSIGAQLSQNENFLRALSSSFKDVSINSQTGTFGLANITTLKSTNGNISNFSSDIIISSTGYIDNLDSNDIKTNSITSKICSFDSIYSNKATVGSVIASTGCFDYLTSNNFLFPATLKIPNIIVTNLTSSNAHFDNISGHFIYNRMITGSSAFFSMISGSNLYSSYLSIGSISGTSAFFVSITGSNVITSKMMATSLIGSSAFIDTVKGDTINVSSGISTNSITGTSAFFISITGGNMYGNVASFSDITGFDAYISSSIETNGLVTSGGLSTHNIFSPRGSVTINDIIGDKVVIGVNTWNPKELDLPWSITSVNTLGKLCSSNFFDVSDDMKYIGSYNSQPNFVWDGTHSISKDKGVTWQPCLGEGKYDINGLITVSRDGSLWIATRNSSSSDGGIYSSIDGKIFSKVLTIQMTGILSGSTLQCCCISPNNQVILVCLDSCRSAPSSQIPFYVSLNKGITWKTVIPSIEHCWISGATTSFDGKYMLVLDRDGVLLSHNYGSSWICSSISMGGLNRRVAMSHDASHMYFCSIGSPKYQLSTDFGQTWRNPISQLLNTGYYSIDCDKTGRYVYLLGQQKLLFSNNYGENFTEHEMKVSGTDIRISCDGSKIFVFDGIGNIMTKEIVDRNVHTGILTVNGTVNAHSSVISSLKADTIIPFSSKMISVSGVKMINSSILGLRRYMITPKLAFRAVSFWKMRDTIAPMNSICWSPELNLLCGVTKDIVQISRDAEKWESISIVGEWKFVCWSGEKGMFLVSGGAGDFMYSQDGKVWNTSKLDINEIKAMCYCQELGKFCILENEESMVGSDGIEWEIGSMNSPSMSEICWSNDLEVFCCIGESSILSSDGISWSSPSVLSETYNAICWASDLDLFCAVGNNVISVSQDGKKWTTVCSPSNTNWANITWSPELHIIISVGNSEIGYSYDGTIWHSTNIPEGNWTDVCWSKELGIFVVTTPEKNQIMISRYVKKF
jgi:hypothetical protein